VYQGQLQRDSAHRRHALQQQSSSVYATQATILDSRFQNNAAYSGGALSLFGNVDALITGSTVFTSNRALQDSRVANLDQFQNGVAGALFYNCDENHYLLCNLNVTSGTLFQLNSADFYGGAIISYNKLAILDSGIRFFNNSDRVDYAPNRGSYLFSAAIFMKI
jgi:hypothetical protein